MSGRPLAAIAGGWCGLASVGPRRALARAGGRAARRRRPGSAASLPTTVTVVVPARDEAARIGRLLEALRREPTATELIVVDDESTDATAELRGPAAPAVLPGAPLPAGWAGSRGPSSRGCALAAASGSSPSTPTPARRGLPAALVRGRRRRRGPASVAGRIDCPRPCSRFHPSMLTTLVYRFGPPGTLRRPGRARWPTANAPSSAGRPSSIAGGYEGRPATSPTTSRSPGTSRELAGGSASSTAPACSVRMYESAAEAWRDWGRSLPIPDVTAPAPQVLDLAVVLVAQALPLPRLLVGRADAARPGAPGSSARHVGRHPAGAYAAPVLPTGLSPLADPAAVGRVAGRRPARPVVARAVVPGLITGRPAGGQRSQCEAQPDDAHERTGGGDVGAGLEEGLDEREAEDGDPGADGEAVGHERHDDADHARDGRRGAAPARSWRRRRSGPSVHRGSRRRPATRARSSPRPPPT